MLLLALLLPLAAAQCVAPNATTCNEGRQGLDAWTQNAYTLVRDFFTLKDVRRATHVACSPEESLGLARVLRSGPSLLHWQSGPAVSVAAQESAVGLAVFVNLSCAAGVASLAAVATVHATWLVWSPDPTAAEVLGTLGLAFNVDLTLVNPAPDGESAELLELYKVRPGAPLQRRPIGSWRRNGGLTTYSPVERLRPTRQDLQGIALRAVVVFHHTTVDGDQAALRRALEDNRNINLDTQSRFGYGLAVHLAEMYNFTYELAVTSTWGFSVSANGSFDGMLGMLQRGEADLGITTSVINLARLRAVDYTVAQTWKFRVCFVFRHPRTLMPYKALAEPFALSSWLAVAAVGALVVALLATVRRCEDADGDSHGGGGPVAEAALVVVGILSQQGSVLGSALVSGRCVLLVSLLLGVMLQSFYTSAIVTSLLKPIPRTIRSIQDLIHSPLKVGLEEFVYNRATFQNSTDPLTATMYNGKIVPAWSSRPDGGFFAAADGVARVRRGDFAFGTEASTLYPPIEDTFSVEEKCSLSEVEFANSGNAATVPKKSPYKELFSRGYLLMLERGLRDRQRRRWSAPRPSCEKGSRALNAVGLDPIFPAHALLLLGHVTSLLLLKHERRTARITGTKTPTSPCVESIQRKGDASKRKLSNAVAPEE